MRQPGLEGGKRPLFVVDLQAMRFEAVGALADPTMSQMWSVCFLGKYLRVWA